MEIKKKHQFDNDKEAMAEALFKVNPDEDLGEIKRRVLRKYNLECANPKCKRAPVDFHHIIFRSQGGEDMENNLIPVCRMCHVMIHKGVLKIKGGWIK